MDIQELKEHFLALCYEHGIISPDEEIDCTMDLVESGMIDSMGIMILQSIIDENYNIFVPEPVFVAELRSINDVLHYIAKNLSIKEFSTIQSNRGNRI